MFLTNLRVQLSLLLLSINIYKYCETKILPEAWKLLLRNYVIDEF